MKAIAPRRMTWTCSKAPTPLIVSEAGAGVTHCAGVQAQSDYAAKDSLHH